MSTFNCRQSVLADELRIQWHPDHHPEMYAGSYVRECVTATPDRNRRPHWPGIVAWAVLKPEAQRDCRGGWFARRIWSIQTNDPYLGAWPYEGVSSLSIRAGQLSKRPQTRNVKS